MGLGGLVPIGIGPDRRRERRRAAAIAPEGSLPGNSRRGRPRGAPGRGGIRERQHLCQRLLPGAWSPAPLHRSHLDRVRIPGPEHGRILHHGTSRETPGPAAPEKIFLGWLRRTAGASQIRGAVEVHRQGHHGAGPLGTRNSPRGGYRPPKPWKKLVDNNESVPEQGGSLIDIFHPSGRPFRQTVGLRLRGTPGRFGKGRSRVCFQGQFVRIVLCAQRWYRFVVVARGDQLRHGRGPARVRIRVSRPAVGVPVGASHRKRTDAVYRRGHDTETAGRNLRRRLRCLSRLRRGGGGLVLAGGAPRRRRRSWLGRP
mmetsp:Transcript_23502/g.55674  ORF Transcript_23502/g.55674 Transcript_23502/m.55674 type:complete len:313 (-) Transcript_23502:207-1145(-)